jgi:hypothetical protein
MKVTINHHNLVIENLSAVFITLHGIILKLQDAKTKEKKEKVIHMQCMKFQ